MRIKKLAMTVGTICNSNDISIGAAFLCKEQALKIEQLANMVDQYKHGMETMNTDSLNGGNKSGITDSEDKKQKAVCVERYRRRDDEDRRQHSDHFVIERKGECGICMEMNSKIVLPNCNHALCLKCYREW